MVNQSVFHIVQIKDIVSNTGSSTTNRNGSENYCQQGEKSKNDDIQIVFVGLVVWTEKRPKTGLNQTD